MNQQPQNKNSELGKLITTQEAVNLLFGEGWLNEAVWIEDEGNSTISAGLDWLNRLPPVILNLSLFERLSTLRISLNREIKLIVETWNLGVATKAATETAMMRIKQHLLSPSPELIPYLEATLLQDDLYGEEFISNREVLKFLVAVLLTDADKEEIANQAANSIHTQVISQVNFLEKPSTGITQS
ncbi:hypothetical protein H6G33_06385 [Calothrix sp. FACHB-1219]|uniref:hypothetical protein n=1 Tax=unclassified Calothrix TaxID=2619626 RepID=UPI0016850A11|nr:MULTISPECIES: hypothetical protein [unclassified Calothrix]MBD2204466.1 hypothetical protein [Calothrix sp. FACHB-168]MBD2216655.1 hypothetical protein [Calothrix sp. FACHB-1219]